MRQRTLLTMITVMAIVSSSCGGGGGGDDATTTLTTVSTTTIRIGNGPTTLVETTTSTQDENGASDCLPTVASVSATAGRAEVGKITERFKTNVEADCEKVSGGEAILAAGVLVTDAEGKTAFETDFVESCHLNSRSEVVVAPSEDLVFEVMNGEVLCTITAGGPSTSFNLAGTSVYPVPGQTVTFSALVQGPQTGSASLEILSGFATIHQPALGCAAIAGPFQRVELRPAEPPVITWYDIGGLDAFYFDPVITARSSVEPPEVPEEILPGLGDLFVGGEATVLVDGRLIGEQDIADTTSILEHLLKRRIEIDIPGRIRDFQPPDLTPTPPGTIPTVTIGPIDPGSIVTLDPGPLVTVPFEPGPIITLPFDPSKVFVTEPIVPLPVEADVVIRSVPFSEVLRNVDLTDALEVQPEEPVVLDLLIDPQGRRWSIAYDEADEAAATTTHDQLTAFIQSGSYTAFYEETFEVLPNYGDLFPNLYRDFDPCILTSSN